MTDDSDHSPAYNRIWNDSAEGVKITDANPVAHSEEAIRILTAQGVEAYEAHLAQQGE